MLNKKSYSQRQLKVAELIKAAIADIMKKGKMPDIRLFEAKVTISDVEISPDLKNVKCLVLNFPGSNLSHKDLIEALENSHGFIRHKLNSMVKLKYSPEIKFEYDHSFDKAHQIDQLLSQI